MASEPILIVDDNLVNVKLTSALLAAEGFDVHSATSAVQAMSELESLSPSLILMDLQMPDMDGLELTRRLKADPKTSSIPIIAFTAYVVEGSEQQARDAGCDGYITKPIDVNMPNVLREYIERAGTSRD